MFLIQRRYFHIFYTYTVMLYKTYMNYYVVSNLISQVFRVSNNFEKIIFIIKVMIKLINCNPGLSNGLKYFIINRTR